jgi:hypothetical protein
MEKYYPLLNKDYYNHERIIGGPVRVLYIAKNYFSGEEQVVYQVVHTQEIGVISLEKWDEMVDMGEGRVIHERPRFYHN